MEIDGKVGQSIKTIKLNSQAHSLEVPKVDHTLLEDQAGKVEKEALRIRQEAERLISVNQVDPS